MQGARIARDRLLDFMSDDRFHSAYELDRIEELNPGDWTVLMRELIEYGYGFGRRGNSFILRERRIAEKPQDLAELLAGVDARVEEDMNRLHAREVAEREVLVRQGIAEPSLGDTPPLKVVLGHQSESQSSRFPGEDDVEPGEDDPGFDVSDDAGRLPEENDRLVISIDPKGCVLSARLSVTSTFAILAKKKAGKTYLAMVIAEEYLRHGLPFVVIDPTGVWWGLRSLANGTASPWSLLIFGGKRGDISIKAEDGAKVASAVIAAWPRPAIIDLSRMPADDQHRFVADFCTRLYVDNERPLHIFFDEADESMPQSPDSSFKHQRRCLAACDQVVRRGRVKGLGATLITQRPAVIHKNVLSQIDGYFLLQMAAPHDLDAVETWLKPVVVNMSERGACLRELPRLGRGDVYFVQNGEGTVAMVRFLVRPKETFNSSRTPTMDDPNPPTPDLSAVDAKTLAEVMQIFGEGDGDDDGDEP